MTEEVEACLRVVIRALAKSELPAADIAGWCADMTRADRVGFVCDQELRGLREQVEAS